MALAPVGIQVVATNVNSFLAAVNSMNRRMQLFGSTARTTSKGTGGLSKSIDVLGAKITKVGHQATRAGLSLSFLATIPIAIGFTKATQSAIDFERELTKLNTLVGLPSDQIKQISDEILGMGNAVNTTGIAIATGITPTEAASAAYFILSKSTRDVADANELVAHTQQVLEVSAKASAIGMGEVEVIAGALTSVLSAYGQENITAARAGDILTAAIDRGAFEADELAGTIGKTLGIVVNMGVSFEEATAFMATFSLVGSTAAETSTGLRRALLALLKPTGAAKDALEAIGASADTIQASLREAGLLNTLAELKSRFDEYGIGLEQIFTRETGLNAVLLLTGQLQDEYIDNLDAIINSHGKLEASFAAVSQTTGFQLQQLRASLEVLGVVIGRSFLPAINALIQRILPMIKAFADWAAEHPKLLLIATALLLITAAIGPLLVGIGFLITAIGSIVGAFGTVLGILGSIISPIGLVVVAILALGAALVTGLAAGFQHLRQTGDQAADFFDNLGQRALAWGKNIVVQLAKGIIQGIIFVVKALTQLGNVISHWLSPGSPPALLPDLPEWGQAAMQEWINGFTSADFGTFRTITGTIEQFLRGIALDGDTTLVPTILAVHDAIGEVIAQVQEMGVVSADAIADIVSGLNLGNAQLEAYVTAMLAVAEASEQVAAIQQEIADINASFDEVLGPLNEELQALNDREKALDRANQLATIAEALSDPDLTAEEKERLLIRKRQLELQALIEEQEALRDVQLEAAEEALAAAEAELASLQEEADRQQELINLQIDHNALLREQMELLASLVEEMDDLAGAIGGAGDELNSLIDGDFGAEDLLGLGDGEFETPEFDLADLIGQEVLDAAEELKTTLSTIFDPIKEDIDALKLAWQELGIAWGPVVQSIIDGTTLDTVQQNISDLITSIPIPEELRDVGDRFVKHIGDGIQHALNAGDYIQVGWWEQAGVNFGAALIDGLEAVIVLGQGITLVLGGFLLKIATWFADQDWIGLWKSFKDASDKFISGLWIALKVRADQFFKDVVAWFEAQDWTLIGFNATKALIEGLKNIFSFVREELPMWMAAIGLWVTQTFNPFLDEKGKSSGRKFVEAIIEGLIAVDQALRNAVRDLLVGAVTAVFQELAQMWSDFWSSLPGGTVSGIGPGQQQPPGDGTPATPPGGSTGGGSPGVGAQRMFGQTIAAPAARVSIAAPPANGPITMNFNTQITSGSARDEAWFRGIVRQEVAAAMKGRFA